MNKHAEHCLRRLIQVAETQPDRKRDVLCKRADFSADSRDPYPFRNAASVKEFHAALRLAEQQGYITLEWEKHYMNSSLKQIRLRDAKGLAGFIHHTWLPDRLTAIHHQIQWPPDSHWLNEEIGQVLDAWRRGKRKYGLAVDDHLLLNTLIKAVLCLEQPEPANTMIDYRQFGARYLGNSKALAPIKGAVAQVFSRRLGKPDLDTEDMLAELNLVRLAHPVYISGPVVFIAGENEITASVRPYLGIPADLLTKFTITSQPDYLLTIENLSSFLEYTATINDNAIVLYTGGYPARRFQQFYEALISNTETPLYHWGDSDPHGFQILKVIQALSPQRPVKPHAMESPGGGVFSQEQLQHLEKLLPINTFADALITRYLEHGRGLAEQETVTASSPLT